MKSWYSIRSAGKKDQAEIYIYEEIGEFWGEGVGAKAFVKDLNEIKTSVINLRINSPGGSVFDAFTIYNALVRHPARIETDIDGLAASAASYVALAGNEVRMAENALFMIHDPSGIVMGSAHDMRGMADTLDKVQENIVGIYNAKTKKPEADLVQLMHDETWFTASEARDAGFIDVITENLAIAASFDLSRYKHPPCGAVGMDQLLTRTGNPVPEAWRGKLAHMALHARRR